MLRRSGYGLHALACCGVTVGLVFALQGSSPDSAERSRVSLAAVLSMGWGHLLGPLWFGRVRTTTRRVGESIDWLRAGRSAVLVSLAFFVFWTFLASDLPLASTWGVIGLLVVLAIALWHIVENEAAIAAGFRAGGALPSGPRAPVVCAAVAIAGAGLSLVPTLAGLPPALVDVYVAAVAFHMLSWLLVFARRSAGAGGQAAARLGLELTLIHVPGLALGAWLFFAPEAPAPLRDVFFSPLAFGFCSSIHVWDTLRLRRARAATR